MWLAQLDAQHRRRLQIACASSLLLSLLLCAIQQRLFLKLKYAVEVRGPPDRLVICTTVSNEVSYMPEWIEFYALQGATRIVIGDHLSRDSLHALAGVYAGRPGYPVVELLLDPGYQAPFLQACARSHSRSKWILFVDNDEFMWSPQFGSLFAYLDTMPKEVTQVTAFGVRFGVGSCRKPAQLRVVGGRLNVTRAQVPAHAAENGSFPFPLVIESHPRRMATTFVDPAEAAVFAALRDSGNVSACRANYTAWARGVYGDDITVGGSFCVDNLITFKSFVRGDAFSFLTSGNPHFAQLKRGITHREMNSTLLRFNHYWVRCRSIAYLKARQWNKHDPIEWVEQAAPLGEAVLDEGLMPFVEPIKQRMAKLLA